MKRYYVRSTCKGVHRPSRTLNIELQVLSHSDLDLLLLLLDQLLRLARADLRVLSHAVVVVHVAVVRAVAVVRVVLDRVEAQRRTPSTPPKKPAVYVAGSDRLELDA